MMLKGHKFGNKKTRRGHYKKSRRQQQQYLDRVKAKYAEQLIKPAKKSPNKSPAPKPTSPEVSDSECVHPTHGLSAVEQTDGTIRVLCARCDVVRIETGPEPAYLQRVAIVRRR